MIIETKENGSNKELADKLKELLNNLPDNHPKRKFIEADYYKLLAGNSGEKGVEYNLRFWYKDDPDIVIINNLRLEYNDRVAQIDHLIITQAGFMVIESKSFTGKILVEEDGSWYRVRKEGDEEVKEWIYNPAEQNNRHITVIQDILNTKLTDKSPRFINVIVINKAYVQTNTNKSNDFYIIRPDKLKGFIDNFKQFSTRIDKNLLIPLAEELLKYHVPFDLDVYKRYDIDPKEAKPLKERLTFDLKKGIFVCEYCNSEMILRKSKFGLYWACSQYPQCKNTVPAEIAAQVSKEVCEKYNKSLTIIDYLFGIDDVKPCPACGSLMKHKEGRKGRYWICSNQLCNHKYW